MNFSFENVLIMIILFGFLYIIFWMMIKTKNTVLKFVVIFSVFLFFILFCVRRNEKSYYELNSIGTSYETNENNKITLQDAIGNLPPLQAGESDPHDFLHKSS